ncbi:hypothetical protein B7463_g1986, partial [Scytalidium lignicola]
MEFNQSRRLPTGLAGVLNKPEESRDSAYFSISDAGSKHNSTISMSNSTSILTPPTSSYPSSVSDKTPSPIATNLHTHHHSLASPTSGGMSVASLVSPTSPGSLDQSIARRYDGQFESSPNSAGLSAGEIPSRRESVDSRLGQNFGDLKLASSPYHSNNHSTASIQSTLAQQRNPGLAGDRLSSRFTNSYQPNSQRQPEVPNHRHSTIPRTAPTITGPSSGNIARAREPTKGQAWAWPEEECHPRYSAAASRNTEETVSLQGTNLLDSRRNSFASSIDNSSIWTSDSRAHDVKPQPQDVRTSDLQPYDSNVQDARQSESKLPPGQRRLEDGMPPESQQKQVGELQTTHHHTLQHKQVSNLQNGEGGTPTSTQPYSRTPELRVSHKIAERKRRTEMKDLFDALRDRMPQDRGSKASKWEILSKAITEHKQQTETIESLYKQARSLRAEIDGLRREAFGLRTENSQLRSENGSLHQTVAQLKGVPINTAPPPQAPPAPIDGYQYSQPPPNALPPIRSLGSPVQPAPDSMSGVQYQNQPEQPRVNGYQPEPPRYDCQKLERKRTQFLWITIASYLSGRSIQYEDIAQSPLIQKGASVPASLPSQNSPISKFISQPGKRSTINTYIFTSIPNCTNFKVIYSLILSSSSIIMHLIRRSALRAASSASAAFSKPQSINTASSPFLLRSKTQSAISSSVLRRYNSDNAFKSEENSTTADVNERSSIKAAIDSASEGAPTSTAGFANADDVSAAPRYGDGFRADEGRPTYGDRRRAPRPTVNLTPSNSVYVGNLLFDIRAEDLEKEFAEFGPIKSVKIATDGRGLSKGFGYVEFETQEQADDAIKARHQTEYEGRTLVVSYKITTERAKAQNPPSQTLFIGNLAYEMSDADLNQLFRDIRNVIDVRVAIDRRTGQPRGFAHADFVDVDSAVKAFEALNGKDIYGRQLRCDYSLGTREKRGDGSGSNMRARRQSSDNSENSF